MNLEANVNTGIEPSEFRKGVNLYRRPDVSLLPETEIAEGAAIEYWRLITERVHKEPIQAIVVGYTPLREYIEDHYMLNP